MKRQTFLFTKKVNKASLDLTSVSVAGWLSTPSDWKVISQSGELRTGGKGFGKKKWEKFRKGKKLKRKTTLEAISVSHVSFIFVFRTGTEKMHGKTFLMLSFGLFYPPYTPVLLLLLFPLFLSFLSISYPFSRIQPLPLTSSHFILLDSSLFPFFFSVRRHYSENVGCSFLMYEVFFITLNL